MERKGIVTFQGTPLTLMGAELRAGDQAPDFTLLDNELNEVRLSDFRGKTKVISITPSLDTPVCDMQARRFNEEAAKLPEDIVVFNVSMDLPFAISRFCTTAGIDKVKTLSDHRDASFGTAYGVLIKELRLLTRAIVILDKEDVIKYLEIVPEVTDQPDYAKAIQSIT